MLPHRSAHRDCGDPACVIVAAFTGVVMEDTFPTCMSYPVSLLQETSVMSITREIKEKSYVFFFVVFQVFLFFLISFYFVSILNHILKTRIIYMLYGSR